MAARNFDLNIERVLEHWTVVHAIREIVANALDEQALTGTREPSIFKDDAGRWHIRDSGRGLRYEHLTQNENQEKLDNPEKVVGKFGVGLKDALATFDRHGVRVIMRSQFGDISTSKTHKHGFEDVDTLHALIDQSSEPSMIGTDVVLDGVTDGDIREAQALFLHYASEELLEETAYGSILQRGARGARIYVTGLRIAEEPNFLFSYNITALSKGLRQALNRERSHVGRSAYTDRVKAILLACQSAGIAEVLSGDLAQFQAGTMHDELQWTDVALHATRVLNARQEVIFVTASQLAEAPDLVGHARDDGYRPVVVPDSVRLKLPTVVDIDDRPIRDLGQYRRQWEDSFSFNFVEPQALNPAERTIWARTEEIFGLVGGRPSKVREVRISESMRPESYSLREAIGLWDPAQGCIIVKRSQLANLPDYAGTLLHELAHARSGATDVSFSFERELTRELGEIAAHQLGRTLEHYDHH